MPLNGCYHLVLVAGIAATLIVSLGLLPIAFATSDTHITINGSTTGGAIQNFSPAAPFGSIVFQVTCNTATGMPGSGSFSGTLGGSAVTGTFSITFCPFISVPLPSCTLAAEAGLAGFVNSGSFVGEEMSAVGCVGTGHSQQIALLIGPPPVCLGLPPGGAPGYPICASYFGLGTGTAHQS